MVGLSVLGIPVTAEQVERWVRFYSSPRQPFRLNDLSSDIQCALPTTPDGPLTNELRDTHFVYGGGSWVWLSEEEFQMLSPRVRAALVEERRHRTRPKPPVAWPTDPLLRTRLVRWIEAGVLPSLHALAETQLHRVSRGPLPRAADLAGTFPSGSGPNCFGTVMAAAGQPVERDWVLQEQFKHWLREHTCEVTRGSDLEPGRVLLWHVHSEHEHSELAHAAVTLGDGWVLHKPSQSWSSPTLVWTVDELVRSWRLPGTRLSRRAILAA